MASNQQPPPQPVRPARVDAAPPQPRFSPRSAYRTSAIIAVIPWLILFGLVIYQTDWPYLTDWILAGTVTTFVFFLADKVFAKTGGSRIPAGILLGMSLLGGVIGGWAGMLLFRHKISHRMFWAVLSVAAVIWIAAGSWYFLIR